MLPVRRDIASLLTFSLNIAEGMAIPQIEPKERMNVHVAVAVATSLGGRDASRGGICINQSVTIFSSVGVDR